MRIATIIIFILALALPTMGQNPTLVNDLTFGSMFPGIPKVVSKYTPGEAAEFHISGTPGVEVSVTFTLPKYVSSGGFNFDLIFLNTDLSADDRITPNQSVPQVDNQNPWLPYVDRLGAGGLTLWLGGTAVPKLIQQAGSYSGTIVCTVDTTGG